MKYKINFGNIGGLHSDCIVLPNKKTARQLAESLVWVFANDEKHTPCKWLIFEMRNCPRETWQSASHFVQIEKGQ